VEGMAPRLNAVRAPNHVRAHNGRDVRGVRERSFRAILGPHAKSRDASARHANNGGFLGSHDSGTDHDARRRRRKPARDRADNCNSARP